MRIAPITITKATIGDVANFQTPSIDLSAIALARYPQKCYCACALRTEVGKSFFAGKNLVTAQAQLRFNSEQQRAFGISNICYFNYRWLWHWNYTDLFFSHWNHTVVTLKIYIETTLKITLNFVFFCYSRALKLDSSKLIEKKKKKTVLLISFVPEVSAFTLNFHCDFQCHSFIVIFCTYIPSLYLKSNTTLHYMLCVYK